MIHGLQHTKPEAWNSRLLLVSPVESIENRMTPRNILYKNYDDRSPFSVLFFLLDYFNVDLGPDGRCFRVGSSSRERECIGTTSGS